jgi:hypothetical protein
MQWVPALSRLIKRPGRGVDHPPPSSAEVKERVELLLLWAFVVCSRVNFTSVVVVVIIIIIIIIIIKSGKLRWMGHERNMGEIRNVCRSFVGGP